MSTVKKPGAPGEPGRYALTGPGGGERTTRAFGARRQPAPARTLNLRSSFLTSPLEPMRQALVDLMGTLPTDNVLTIQAGSSFRLAAPGKVLLVVDGELILMRARTAISHRVEAGMILVSEGSDALLADFPQITQNDSLTVSGSNSLTCVLLDDTAFTRLPGFRAVTPGQARALHFQLACPELNKDEVFTVENLIALMEVCPVRRVNEGASLISQGPARNQQMFLVLDGYFRVIRRNQEELEYTTRVGPGELLGESGFLGAPERSAEVMADGPARVLVLDPNDPANPFLMQLAKDSLLPTLQRIETERINRGSRVISAAPSLLKLADKYKIDFPREQAEFISDLLEPLFLCQGALKVRGHKVTEAGAPLYVVESGRLAVTNIARFSSTRTTLGPGSIVGEMGWLRRGSQITATVTVDAPSIVLKLDPQYLSLIRTRAPGFIAVLEKLARERGLLHT